MANEQRDYSKILLQIAAVRKALDSTAKVLLKDHLESCVVDAVHHGNQCKVLDDLNKALDSYIRCDGARFGTAIATPELLYEAAGGHVCRFYGEVIEPE